MTAAGRVDLSLLHILIFSHSTSLFPYSISSTDNESKGSDSEGDADELHHQDRFDDEFFEEEGVQVVGEDEDGEGEGEGEGEDGDQNGEHKSEGRPRVWRAGIDEIGDDEVLDYDPTAYTVYQKLQTEWPCLSFDILDDGLGNYRTKFPLTLYVVAGSQADERGKNKVNILKISSLYRTSHQDLDDDGIAEVNMDANAEDEDDDNLDEEPQINSKSFAHDGGVNRVRAMKQNSSVIATWADTGLVHIWDITDFAQVLDTDLDLETQKHTPIFTFDGHNNEGFAMDWSNMNIGQLVTGGLDAKIFNWMPAESTWVVDTDPFVGHTASVEDLQWSPSEESVFASCSADGTIRFFDVRMGKEAALTVVGSKTDMNVISWNQKSSHLIASGDDNGTLKVWDLRALQSSAEEGTELEAVAHYDWHRGPITSLEWHPHDDSVLAASSEDNSVSIWDMALEADVDEIAKERTGADVGDMKLPPQLLFEHRGQKDIKEVHFHRQIPDLLLSTAEDGIDIFRPANMSVILPPAAPGSSTGAGVDGVTVD